MTIASHVDTIIEGIPFKFTRRREGMKVFTRAQFHHEGAWHSCGDEWPSANPPRGELLLAMNLALSPNPVVLR